MTTRYGILNALMELSASGLDNRVVRIPIAPHLGSHTVEEYVRIDEASTLVAAYVANMSGSNSNATQALTIDVKNGGSSVLSAPVDIKALNTASSNEVALTINSNEDFAADSILTVSVASAGSDGDVPDAFYVHCVFEAQSH